MLLEAYFVQIDGTLNKLSAVSCSFFSTDFELVPQLSFYHYLDTSGIHDKHELLQHLLESFLKP